MSIGRRHCPHEHQCIQNDNGTTTKKYFGRCCAARNFHVPLTGSIGKETTPWSSSPPPIADQTFSGLVRKTQRNETEMSKDKMTTI
ncbi:hypothetical protein HNY73_018812 [Argiope bruennichi]|uniref:Uncharacterized protein n=1 Tax=Argiope bruennichi TaxID=94029 RepID=A0A8T0EEE8_ARGBR|nr:hypothetical protein HNY73_018812 [Argiope bruennichi]